MKTTGLIKTGLSLFIIALLLVFIILVKNVLIPLVVAMFLSYLMYPLVWGIERRGVNRAISILMVLFTVIVLIGVSTFLLSLRASNISIDFDEVKEQLDDKSISVQHIVKEKLGINGSTADYYVDEALDNIASSWQSEIGTFFSATTTTLFQIGILPVFVFFLLFYRTKTARFIFRITPREKRPTTLHILREISTVTTKYLGGLFLVVTILAVLNSLGLFIIGIKHALVFGVLAAFLNLIPYAGTFLGGFIPFAYVFFIDPNPFAPMLKIAALFVVIQFIENNLLTPNIVGNSIKINPLAIILSLLFANMVWGIAGMLVVVPVLATVKVIMRNIENLKPYAFLISDRGMEKHKIKMFNKRNSKN
ncbi:AI-2E family transporter [Maribellus comscasis]|uniref:AI-2E family transporter n=1 Tax=Maribellus comscasis TaxID=2681766 RepID=A0A6I6JX08_9BACT|nr:AI-2E family transporter [Maribellus comscasis]QGY47666.1 AI-2E family transporter [Maribellus comscasis]